MYRFTVEYLEDSKGSTVDFSPLLFETRNHENMFKMVEKMKGKIDPEETAATAFAVRLKLFSEVML